MRAPLRVLALTDDKPGNRTQTLGVAETLAARTGGQVVELKLGMGLLAKLPNALLGAHLWGYDPASWVALKTTHADVAVAAGRRLVPALRWLKRRKRMRTLYLMRPDAPLSEFNLVAVPEHDMPAAASNLITTLGAPHRIDPAKAQAAAEHFANLPRPRVALLAGGDAGGCHFTAEDWRRLGAETARLATQLGAQVLVTTSRRTGETGTAELMAALPGAWFHRWRPEGENPYLALLGAADAIVVTGESMSMASEACAMGVPVFLFVPQSGVAPKHARLQARLVEAGYARMLTEDAVTDWRPPAPLDEAGRVAEAFLSAVVPA